MYISQHNKEYNFKKQIIVFSVISLVLTVFSQVYLLKSHGVWSWSMALVPLFSVLGGLYSFVMEKHYEKGIILYADYIYNAHNVHGFEGETYQGKLFLEEDNILCSIRWGNNFICTGIGLISSWAILHGILYIAGTDSPYIPFFIPLTLVFVSLGIFFLAKGVSKDRKLIESLISINEKEEYESGNVTYERSMEYVEENRSC